jgi:hypothetical protein
MTMPVAPTTIGGEDERPPVADAGVTATEIRAERAHHVLGAVREVDDVEEAEDHREAERQHRVERTIDEADQELAEERLHRHAENFSHGRMRRSAARVERRSGAAPRARRKNRYFTSEQYGSPFSSFSGRNAWSAGIVARTL